MFNMKRVGKNSIGYELRIAFDAEANEYYLTGYDVRRDSTGKVIREGDGKTLIFETMEEVLNWIGNYNISEEPQGDER